MNTSNRRFPAKNAVWDGFLYGGSVAALHGKNRLSYRILLTEEWIDG